jgi:catechol 2,3-dioxygenase
MKTLQLTGLTLRVRDLERQLAFYRDLLGLAVQGKPSLLAPGGRRFELELIHDPSAPLRPQPSLGLYHFALLLPSRAALAAIFRRLVEARYPNWDGASDHGVSEALYLRDPEGNGIELYRDRPQLEWPYRDGKLAMVTDPLDLDQLLLQAPAGLPLDPQTTFGHLHLHVANLDEAQSFYARFGMDLIQGDIPSARFLSRDGYHHHIGVNLWARGRTAPKQSTGLLGYRMALAPRLLESVEPSPDMLGLQLSLEALQTPAELA